MTLPKLGQSRLAHEIAVLAILAVLVGAYFLLMKPAGAPAPAPKVAPLNTTFDTDTLDQVEQKDNNYPAIPPTTTGRDDPYAP